MAGNIPMGSMSTEIKLNGSQSVKTLRELKQAVTQATSAWKAQRAELSTIGKSTEAAEAKYKGLAETIKKQKDYISGLQEAQKHLTEAQKSVDRSTKEGRQEYGKYNEALQKNETRIHSAEQKLVSLTNQQTKAKSSLNYYKSGLAEAQKTLKTTTAVSRSYVERLESEGNHYKANEARISGYRSSINNLTKQYEIQSRELKRIAGEAGVTSEAYKHQQIRVNETATSLNKARLAVSGLEEEQRKVNPTPWDRLKAKISSVNKESQETHRTFREVFMGSALGNAISNAVSNLGSSLKSAYTEGMNLNLAIAKINGRFKGMGMNTRQIQALDKQIGELKSNTNLAGDSASNLQAHMLNWSTIGFKGAMQMSKALAGVGDSSKMTGQQIDQMSAGLQRIGSNGKVTYSSLSRITKAAPTFMATLAHGAGMSESKLRALLKTGDVTQKQFQTWIAKSSKYADESFKGYGQSQAGALKTMTVARQKLEQEFTKPIFDAKTSGLQALKNIMTSKEVMAGANQLGKAISNIIGYLDKHKGDIVAITKNVVSLGVEVGKAVWKDFAAIIQNIGKTLGIVKDNGKESSSALHTLANATADLAKNKTAVQWIAKAIITMAAVKGLDHVGGGLFAIGQKGYHAYKNVKALRAGLKGTQDIKDFGDTEQGFFKLGDAISTATDKVKDFITSAKGIKAGKIFGTVGTALIAGQQGIQAIKDRHSADKRSKDIGGAVGALAGGTLTSMIPVVGPMLAPVGAIIGKYAGRWGGQAVNNFTKGWQRNKPPKKFWSLENLGYSAHNMWNGFMKDVKSTLKWFKKNWKEVGLYFVSPLAGAINSLYKHNPKFRKWVKSLVKSFKNAWKGIGKWFGNVGKSTQRSWKGMTHWFSNLGKSMAKGLKSAWKGMAKWFSNISNGIKKAWGSMTSWFTKLGTGMSKGLKATWHTVARWFGGIARGVQRAWSGMSHFFGRVGSASVRLFKSAWHGITSWFDGIINGIKKAWDNLFGGISSTVKVIGKLLGGKVKVGNVHLANGTDWRSRYGVSAIVNDAPGENYREGLLVNGQVIPFPDKRNLPFWLLPGQDVVNGNDMARIFGRSARLANGTVNLRSLETNDPTKLLSTLTKFAKKKYDEDRQHHEKQRQRHDRNDNDRAVERERLIKQEHDAKSERAKIAKEIREALSKGRNTKGLTAQFNALTKHISNIKHSIAKTNPHHGQVYVDEGLLIGAKSRIGKSKWISDALFKKLTTKPKKRKTTHKRTTSHRRLSTRKTVTRVSTPHVSGKSVRVSASVSGLSNVRSLANAISAVKSKSVKVTASGSSTKSVSSLAHAIKKIKGGTHEVTVKARGAKSVKSLARAVKKVKGKRSEVTVKSYGSKGLKSLQRNITSTNRQVRSLTKEAKKAKFGKAISQQAVEAVKSLKGEGNFTKQFAKMTKQFDKDLKTMSKNSKKEFKSMWSENEKASKSGEQKLNSELSSFSSKFKHGWSSLENGVHRTFSRFWIDMKNAAGKGVNSVIKVLNSAISKIDSVISDFGGSKTAVHKSGYVHYAGGTDANGRLMHDTLAIVNDAQSGPRQEAVITDTNDVLLPRGKDVPVMLKKGWGVLNGTQTQQLGLPHFANGTGLKGLYELAKKYWNHPVKTSQSMFGAVTGLTGAIKELASKMRNKSENQGTKWWSQLWKMVEDKVDDDLGPASGLLKAVEEIGRGKHYLWGGYGLDSKGLDCSGLVSTALEHYYHSGWGHLDVGGLWQHAHRISKSEAKPGDPVFWLPDEHVGVYAGHGMYYSAYGPNNGGPIGMTPIAGAVSGVSPTFARFNGINTEGHKPNKAIKVQTNNALQKQIKVQVGKGFWKTIQKIADKYGEAGQMGNPAGRDIGRWRSVIKKALEANHLEATDWRVTDMLRLISRESSGDPHAVNNWDINAKRGDPSKGIAQIIGSNFRIYHFKGHDDIFNGFDNLLAAIAYIKAKYGTSRAVFDRVAASAYANGGIATKASIFGEAGPEMAIPLIPSKSTRAWELIGKAIGILSSQTNFQVQNANNEKERKEEHDFRQAVLLLLTEIAGKSDVAKITLTTPAGRALWSIIQPFAKQENKREITRLRRGLSGR